MAAATSFFNCQLFTFLLWVINLPPDVFVTAQRSSRGNEEDRVASGIFVVSSLIDTNGSYFVGSAFVD
ncbi:hypothetical protein HAX54_026764 [Datura stramonium]|uniref:Secreted protein n=1 Tax=Datura stramonium TaxID=4076 RepID=A0ABS8V2Q2_DATST|nr:hypothetical protein [Datura stramonium]